MPNFKSISFEMIEIEMTELQGRVESALPPPCVCYPKDPMWNRANIELKHNLTFLGNSTSMGLTKIAMQNFAF